MHLPEIEMHARLPEIEMHAHLPEIEMQARLPEIEQGTSLSSSFSVRVNKHHYMYHPSTYM